MNTTTQQTHIMNNKLILPLLSLLLASFVSAQINVPTSCTLDLDIDSDNDNTWLNPEEDDYEESIEMIAPGKMIMKNRNDSENDGGLPDCEDRVINGAADRNDMAVLVLKHYTSDNQTRVTLSASDKSRIRVFDMDETLRIGPEVEGSYSLDLNGRKELLVEGVDVGQVTLTLTCDETGKKDDVLVTVVDVNVTLAGLDETNEESVGGFVQYHFDFPEYTSGHSGLNQNSGYQFIRAEVHVSPLITSTGNDMVVLSYEEEPNFSDAVFVLEGDNYLPARTEYRISELPEAFYIHGHQKDAVRYFRAVHTKSRAQDCVKVTDVEVDLDIDSDNTNGFQPPEKTDFEDWIEDGLHAEDPNKPLKFVVFNDYYDEAMLGKPGYADTEMDTSTGPVEQNLLIPVEFKYPLSLTGSRITVTFNYAVGDPSDITSRILPNGDKEWHASGSMRLWLKKEGRNPGKVTDDPAGDYIPANVDMDISKLRNVQTFYLEGVKPSMTLGADAINAIIKVSYGETFVDMKDEVKCTVVQAALDVDTFNDSGMDEDPHQPEDGEDHYEDMTDRTGKIIGLNRQDKDNDGIPDYLDGFDLNPAVEQDDLNSEEVFVPLVLTLPKDLDYTKMTVRVTYDDDDPKKASGQEEEEDPTEEEGGLIRIWTKAGNEARDKEDVSDPSGGSTGDDTGGDYLAPGTYKASTLGFKGSVNKVTFYVEGTGISAKDGDIRVLFEVKLDERHTGPEYDAADAVRFTCVDSALEITDYFTPRQAESPPYHVCKADIKVPQSVADMCDTMELQVKRSQDGWDSLFFKASFSPEDASVAETKIYEAASGSGAHVYDVTALYGGTGTKTLRVCWDGRKDADGDGTIYQGDDGFNVWADRPENIGSGPVSFNARIVMLSSSGDIVHVSPTATTRTCPLPLDQDNLAMAGPAPYFGFYRDMINSKYRSVMLDSPAVVTKSDGRPCVSFIPYFNGNMWDHTPMQFGWTHNYEIRMLPVYVGVERRVYFQGLGGHLFGPVDENGKLWIFGEQATVEEGELDSTGEPESFTLTTLTGTKYTFNGFGQVESIEDRNESDENKVTVSLAKYGSSGLLIQRVTGATGPGPDLTFAYDAQEENTRLRSVTISGSTPRTLTFDYYEATDVYETPYEADEVLKKISGLEEYVPEFTMDQGRRANRASRVITGSMTKCKVSDTKHTFEHNFKYDQPETLETPVVEAKVTNYDIGGKWRMTEITDSSATYANGQSVTHDYTGNKLQKETVSGNGGSATYLYGYNEQGQRKTFSTADGEGSMDYYDDGTLKKVTTPGLATVELQYGVFGQVSDRKLTDPADDKTREFKYTLDGKGNVTEIKEIGEGGNPDDRSWTIVRNSADGSVQSVTDPSSTQASYAYGNELGLVQSVTRSGVTLFERTYDDYGNLISDKDAKGVGTFATIYDKLDRIQKITYTSGAWESYEYTALGQLEVHTAPATDQAVGLETKYLFTPEGKPTGRTEIGKDVNRTYEYTDVDDEGQVKSMTVSEGGETLKSTFEYDYAGRTVSESWDGVGKPRWEAEYDLMGNVTTSTDGEGNITTMSYYSDNSVNLLTRPSWTSASFGSVTRTIDGFGNVTSVVDDPGWNLYGTPWAVTSYEYDAFNRVKQMTDPADKVWKYTYDVLDNLETVETPKGDIHEYVYDAKSHLDKYILPGPNSPTFDVTADDDGRFSAVKTPEKHTYSMPCDTKGYGLGVVPPQGAGKYGSNENNVYGMPTKNCSGGFEARIGYDSALRLSSYAPPHAKAGNSRSVSYGIYGPQSVTMMDNKTVTRDPVTDNPLARTVKVGLSRVIETVSDGNGNNVSTTLKPTASGETADKTVTTEYDSLGRPFFVTEGGKSTTYFWDGRGNLQAVAAPSFFLFMGYDASDRLTDRTVNGRTTYYGYDDNGNCELIDPPGPAEVNFEYDERDQVKKRIIKIDGDVYRTEVIGRNDDGAIKSRTIHSGGLLGPVICSETFGRDANDRIENFGTRTAADKAFITYSEDSRMTREEWAGIWTETVDPVSGLVTSVAASPAFTFDRDDEGRVTTVTRNGATAYTYGYDASGLLFSETDSTSALGGNAVITHQNDAYGHSMVRGLPSQASLTETLTDDGHVGDSKFTFGGESRTVSFTYNQGLLSTITLPGQLAPVTLSYTMAELTGIASGGFSVGLTRDYLTGRVLTKNLGHLGVTDSYAYHGMGRLTGETRSDDSYEAIYEYDVAGKRTAAQITGDFNYFNPPGSSPEGAVYRVGQGQGFYPTIAAALTQVIMDRGTAEFTSPAIIQLEPGTHVGPQIFQAPNLRPTAANRLIIQSRPGTTATLAGQVAVLSPANVLWRGLVIGGALIHGGTVDASVSACLVTGKLMFFDSIGASVVGNTFKAPTADAPLSLMYSEAVVRNNIFLVNSDYGAAIEELEGAFVDSDYDLYWPLNDLTPEETHGIYDDPLLDSVTFEITADASPAFRSGKPVAGFDKDVNGSLRHPLTPCRGASERMVAGEGDVRDGGGRLIRRVVQNRVQNLAYDGRNRLSSWDWDGSAGTSCTYDYDHAGRRILTRETVAGVTKVTRYVYDGADVCAEYEDSDNDGAVDRTRVYWLLPGMDRRIGFAETVGDTTAFYYYLTDHVGTVLRIVNEAGAVVNQYDYDAFGRVRNSSETVENRYLFQGREWDKNGGFYYFRNRIYLPERGEFSSPDMNLGRGILGELDGMATLTFCAGDPVNCIDPTGLATLKYERRGWFGDHTPSDDRGILQTVFGAIGFPRANWVIDAEERLKLTELGEIYQNLADEQRVAIRSANTISELTHAMILNKDKLAAVQTYRLAILNWNPGDIVAPEGTKITFPFKQYETGTGWFKPKTETQMFLHDLASAFAAGFNVGLCNEALSYKPPVKTVAPATGPRVNLQQSTAGAGGDVTKTTALVKYDADFAVKQGAPVYRLWGEGTVEAGRSWTTVNPRSFGSIDNFKQAAGIGDWVRPPYKIATGQFKTLEGVTSRTALPVQQAPNPWLPELRVQSPQSVKDAVINITSEAW